MKTKLTILFIFTSILAYSQEQKQWTLEDCINYALENNLSLETSKLDLAISEISQKYSKYSHLPTLNATGTHGYNWGQSIDPFTNEFATDRVRSNNLYLSSSWTLFSGFERYHMSKKAKNEVQYNQYNLEIQKRNLKIDVTAHFLQVLMNHYQWKVTQEQLQYTQKEYEKGKKLVEFEEKTIHDLYQIEAQIALDSLTVTKAINELRLSKLRLKQFLCLKQGESFDVNIDVDTTILRINSSVNYNLLPEIEQSNLMQEVSLSNLKISKAKRYPSLVLNSSIGSGYSGNNKERIGSEYIPKPFNTQFDENFYQSATITLSIPIFNNTRVSEGILLSKIEFQKSQIAKEQTLLDVQHKIEQLQIEIENALSEVQTSKTALRSAELSFQSAELKYNEGLITFTEYVEIRTQLFKAQSELLKAKFLYQFNVDILGYYVE